MHTALTYTAFLVSYSLLLRKECCTFSNGEFVKSGLAELELWCCQAKEVKFLSHNFLQEYLIILQIVLLKFIFFSVTWQYAGPSWEELKHIRQAVGFLVCYTTYILVTNTL